MEKSMICEISPEEKELLNRLFKTRIHFHKDKTRKEKVYKYLKKYLKLKTDTDT